MSTLPVAIPEQSPNSTAAMSPFARIVGVLFSPGKTFAVIVRKPSWILPVVLLTVLGGIVAFGINQKVNWREYVAQQIEKNPKAANLSAEQKSQQIEGGAKFAPIATYVFGVPFPLILVLIVAGIMLLSYNLLAGANVNYSTALAITAHAYVPILVANLVFLLVLFLKEPGTLDLDNPLATNLGAFLPEDSAKWLMALAKNIDIFTIWVLFLLAIGFAAANPKKLKGGTSFAVTFGVFAFFLVVRVGLAFVLS
jgi:hypothetical protein